MGGYVGDCLNCNVHSALKYNRPDDPMGVKENQLVVNNLQAQKRAAILKMGNHNNLQCRNRSDDDKIVVAINYCIVLHVVMHAYTERFRCVTKP